MSGAPEEASTPTTKRDLGVEAQRAAMKDRRELFLALHDFRYGRGLEIGPLDAAISDPAEDDVRYVDVFDTAGTRDHYAHDANVLLELVPHVHFPLHQDGRIRTLAEAAAPDAPYDWVIASHVIEHVPDLVGWLEQIAQLTADGARLLLAVPDRRYCFDRHRPPTTLGQVLTAYEERHVVPSVRAVYDFFSTAANVDTRALWKGKRPGGREARIHDLGYTMAQVERARAGQYVDCHVWTLTPQSLLEQIKELRALGLCQWYVETLQERPGTVEFLAVLRRLPRDGEGADVPEPELASDLPDWLEDEYRARDKVRELRGRLKELRARNERLRRRLRAAERSPAPRRAWLRRAVVARARGVLDRRSSGGRTQGG